MRKGLWAVHQGLTVVTLLVAMMEFYLAGIGIFHAASFQIHRVTGIALLASSALLLLLALIGRTGGKTTLFSALLLVMMFVQPLLLQTSDRFVKALHPVNALVILGICAYLVRLGARRKSEHGQAVGS